MIALTTVPRLGITLPVDLTGANVWVTIKQPFDTTGKSLVITDESPTIEVADGSTHITAKFAQEQTLTLREGDAEVQANWILGGERGAMVPATIRVHDNLLREVLS